MTYRPGKERFKEEKVEISHLEKELVKELRRSNKADTLPFMTELIKQLKQVNVNLICIIMVLIGIFIRLIFMSI